MDRGTLSTLLIERLQNNADIQHTLRAQQIDKRA